MHPGSWARISERNSAKRRSNSASCPFFTSTILSPPTIIHWEYKQLICDVKKIAANRNRITFDVFTAGTSTAEVVPAMAVQTRGSGLSLRHFCRASTTRHHGVWAGGSSGQDGY